MSYTTRTIFASIMKVKIRRLIPQVSVLVLTSLVGCFDGANYDFGISPITGDIEPDSPMYMFELSPYRQSSPLNDVHAGESHIVAVGDRGVILHSTDGGQNWRMVESGTELNLNAVKGDGNRLIAVGDSGVIVRSSDGGKNWRAVESDTDGGLKALSFDGNRLVAVGYGGAIVRSTDGGQSWRVVESRTSTNFVALSSDGNRLVAVGDSDVIVRSTDGGQSWRVVESEPFMEFTALNSAGNRLVAVGNHGTIVFSSNGGQSWRAVESDTFKDLKAVTIDGNRLVAVGQAGTIVRSTDGGRIWRKVESRTDSNLNKVATDGNLLVAVGQAGTIVGSTDGGKNWWVVESGARLSLDALSIDGNQLVAVGYGGVIVRSTDGGQSWRTTRGTKSLSLSALSSNGNLLVAVGKNGVVVRSTDGGKRWQVVESRTHRWLYALAIDGNRIVSVGQAGTIVRSIDGGQSWRIMESGTDKKLNTVTADGNLLVAVGENGTIVFSIDGGQSWLKAESGTDQWLKALTIDGDHLVAVGQAGTIVRSTDGGRFWRKVESGTDSDLNDLSGEGNYLVAVGQAGTIVRSTDGGRFWRKVESGTDSDLYRVNSHGDRLVAVGSNGVILRSTNDGQSWRLIDSGTDLYLNDLSGQGNWLFALGTNGTILRSSDSGQSWRVGQFSWRRVHDVNGHGNRIVAVGEDGFIFLKKNKDIVIPTFKKMTINQLVDKVYLNFEFNDPNFMCLEKCLFQVWGRNEHSEKYNQPFMSTTNALKGVRGDDTTVNWSLTIDPSHFGVETNEKLFLKFQLSGKDFSNIYPRDDSYPLSITYKFNAIPYIIALFVLFIVTSLLLVYLCRPLWLLHLYRRVGLFELVAKIKVPGLTEVIQIISYFILLLPYLVQKPRVLDAWVKLNKQGFITLFDDENVVRELRYYPLPLRWVEINDRLKNPSPLDFQSICNTKRTLVQVIGAGGAGKSSFAVQFAKWSLNQNLWSHTAIPIWLDQDIDNLSSLLIQQVRRVTGDDSLPELFIKALYKRKRLLVVVDRLSEKNAATQEAVKNLPGYLCYLLITSRIEQKFSLPEMVTLETIPLKSENLMGFVNDILQQKLEEDSALIGFKEQLDLAQSLANAMTLGGKELPVTPLLVNLFVTKSVENAKTTQSALTHLPQNIPEVYFEHLRSVNPDNPNVENYLPQEAMIETAKLAARITLGDDFVPKRVQKTELREKLRNANIAMISPNTDPIARLLENQVLEERLVGGSTLVGFTLDPVAEYVAAFSYGEECGSDPIRWNKLIHEVTQHGVNASGFFEALKVTHGVFKDKLNWSSIVDWQDDTAKK